MNRETASAPIELINSAKAVLTAFSNEYSISIGQKETEAHSSVAIEVLAYFFKYWFVWAGNPSTLGIKDAWIRTAATELDKVPWMSARFSFAELLAAVSLLAELGLLETTVRDDFFTNTSQVNEKLEVPVIQLKLNAQVPAQVQSVFSEAVASTKKRFDNRRKLIEDRGPGAPIVGPKNMAEMLENIPAGGTIRMAMYSGRTVFHTEDQLGKVSEHSIKELLENSNEYKVKMLILTDKAIAPLNESATETWLRANLVDGVGKIREVDLSDEHLKRLDVRLYGDEIKDGLFRGTIVTDNKDVPIQTLFTIFDFWNERGTYGEIGMSVGDSNLSELLKLYYDQAFENSVPIFKRRWLGFIFQNVGLEVKTAALTTFLSIVVILLALRLPSLANYSKDIIANTIGTLVASVIVLTFGLIPIWGRIKRIRPFTRLDLDRFSPTKLKEYALAREQVEKQKKQEVVPDVVIAPKNPQVDINNEVISPHI